jgi:hypothetical protein
MSMPTIPVKENAGLQLQDFTSQVHEAIAAWKAFRDLATIQYDNAYTKQGTLLGHIKQQLEADRKAASAVLTFAISLVTVAVAGPIAGSLAGEFTGGMDELAAKEFIKWVRNKGEAGAKAAAGAAMRYLHPETLAPDPFAPAGDSPTAYMAKMSLRIDNRDRDLTALINLLSQTNASRDTIISFEEAILNTPFVTEAPDTSGINEDALYRSASLGLWIAWASARDEDYWAARSIDLNQDAVDFEPLRVELHTLRIPADFTLKATGKTKTPYSQYAKRLGTTGLNMKAFIDWATSVHAAVEMFRGLPDNAYVALARKEMMANVFAQTFGS